MRLIHIDRQFSDEEFAYVHHSFTWKNSDVEKKKVIFDLNARFGKRRLLDKNILYHMMLNLKPEYVIADRMMNVYDMRFFKGEIGVTKIIYIADSYENAIEAFNCYDIDVVAFETEEHCKEDRYDIIQKLQVHNRISTPLCLIGFEGNIKDDIFKHRNNPWINFTISDPAYTYGCYGVLFDSIKGKRFILDIDYDLPDISNNADTNLCYVYNKYLMECWNNTIVPKSFVEFIGGRE